MSDSVRPHRRQPTRLPRSWDSPGKNTGLGCHFLHQCVKVKSESEVAQSCPTLSDPMDCSLPGSSVRGIFQASTGVGCPHPNYINGQIIQTENKSRNTLNQLDRTTFIQPNFESSSHSNQRRKRNKRNPHLKGNSKTVTVCR